MPTLYSPGDSLVAVTPHGVVVLEPGSPAAVAAQVRALVADGRGLGGVIEALTGAYGASLTALPSFAVALAEGDSVRVAVRGELVLRIDSASPESISGQGVTTWSERVLNGVARVTMSSSTADASAAAASGSPELPVNDGVILASVVVWEPSGDGSSPAPASAPAQAATPAARAAAPAPRSRAATRAPQPSAVPPGPQVPSAPLDGPPAPPVPPVPPALVPASHGDLIDSSSVPSVASALRSGAPAGGVPVEAPRDAGSDDPLLETIVRGSEPPPAPPVAGDHDGETVSLAQARAMRGTAAVPTSSLPPLAPPRPRAPGRLRVSNGQVVTLDRTVVIGRRPRSTRVSGTDLPHLVAVDSPQQDISRSHVEVRVEGDSIVATDLRTTNGTTLRRPGTDPVRLHPGEATVVVPGDVLDLGDGITVAVEEPS